MGERLLVDLTLYPAMGVEPFFRRRFADVFAGNGPGMWRSNFFVAGKRVDDGHIREMSEDEVFLFLEKEDFDVGAGVDGKKDGSACLFAQLANTLDGGECLGLPVDESRIRGNHGGMHRQGILFDQRPDSGEFPLRKLFSKGFACLGGERRPGRI